MQTFRTLLCYALLVVSRFGFSQNQPTPVPISTVAADYLNRDARSDALHGSEIDWVSVRRGAFQHSEGAQATSDTYSGIFLR